MQRVSGYLVCPVRFFPPVDDDENENQYETEVYDVL